MNELFTSIMQRIAAAMPQLALVDEDYGQLEAGAAEDHYPITFPCVLIGNAEATWDNLGFRLAPYYRPDVRLEYADNPVGATVCP